MISTFRHVFRVLRLKCAGFAAALVVGGFFGLTLLSNVRAADAPAPTKTAEQVVTPSKIVRLGDDGGVAPNAGKPGRWGG